MSVPEVYAFDPSSRRDSDFVAGGLQHLVVGNRGRLLDVRRTPITVVDVAAVRGQFTVRIDAFEDMGTCWELALDEVTRFQFARGSVVADAVVTAALEQARDVFDRVLTIEVDPGARRESLDRVDHYRALVRVWLAERAAAMSVDVGALVERRAGDPILYELLEEFLDERGLRELEAVFSTTFVSNPRSGEVVKGHAIVLAELGLCPYHGKIPRDPELLSGAWSRSRRSEHLLWRMAFTQELLSRAGMTDLVLFRGAASDSEIQPAATRASFVSATLSRSVAEAHFAGGPTTHVAVLWRQRVPLQRALMTFLETRAMNNQYQEAEAVLVGDPSNNVF